MKKKQKKNNKYIYIITIILVIISLIAAAYFKSTDSEIKYVKRFKHINTSEMITGTGKAKYKECEYTYYFDKKGTPSEGGRKYASRLIYPNREIYIEENITYIYDDEIQNVESVLYSEDEITKENANDFIYSLHDETPSCGIQLNEFKKIEENYYYIKFDILGDC